MDDLIHTEAITTSRLSVPLKHNLTLIRPWGQFGKNKKVGKFHAWSNFHFLNSLPEMFFSGTERLSSDAFKRTIFTPRCSTRMEIFYKIPSVSISHNTTIDNCDTAEIFFYYFLNKWLVCGPRYFYLPWSFSHSHSRSHSFLITYVHYFLIHR